MAGLIRAQPAFSADGKYLFFVSDRTFNPTYGQTEFNYSYSNMAKIYLVTLAKETRSPFEPKSDEVKIKEAAKEPAKDANAGQEKKPDAAAEAGWRSSGSRWTGSRALRNFPWPRRRTTIWCPWAASSTTCGARATKRKLVLFDLEKQKETELGDVDGYEISADSKKMLVGQGGSYAIIDLPMGQDRSERTPQPVGSEIQSRSRCGMEADLQRMLAADARLLLCAQHARGGLGKGAQEL